MSLDNYQKSRENLGVINPGESDRYVALIDEEVHPKNEVRVHNEWVHNVEETQVVVLTITQKGASNINSVYVIHNSEAREENYGWSRSRKGDDLPKVTQDDARNVAIEWMENHPDGVPDWA